MIGLFFTVYAWLESFTNPLNALRLELVVIRTCDLLEWFTSNSHSELQRGFLIFAFSSRQNNLFNHTKLHIKTFWFFFLRRSLTNWFATHFLWNNLHTCSASQSLETRPYKRLHHFFLNFHSKHCCCFHIIFQKIKLFSNFYQVFILNYAMFVLNQEKIARL